MMRALRTLAPFLAAFLSGAVGFLLVAIFWPLLFPLQLNGTSWGEEIGPLAGLGAPMLFAICGFLIGRKLTRPAHPE